MTFKLILSAINKDLFESFKQHFSSFPQVEVVFKSFEQVDFDCVVAAANSFGLMDGGIDQCIADYFGIQIIDKVQAQIIQQYYGEQPVGTSLIVLAKETVNNNMRKYKYVAHTPTMRIPMDIDQTSNTYMAMKAMLIAVETHNLLNDKIVGNESYKINSVVCPGLGTNTGRVPVEEAAKMMALAFYHFFNPPTSISWYFATKRHAEIQNRMIAELDDYTNIDLSKFEDLI